MSDYITISSQPQSSDDPLPLIVSKKWNFPLQYHISNKGRYVYAVQDWIAGIAQTSQPAKFWDKLKKRTIPMTGTVELSALCIQLSYSARNGKTYQMDFADDKTLYQITQRMDTNTGLRNIILKYLADAGAFVDKARLETQQNQPVLKKYEEAYIQKKMKTGLSRQQALETLADRVDLKRNFALLMDQIARVCSDKPKYGVIVDTEYHTLFEATSSQLRKILNDESIRDALPPMQLQYLKTAEYGIRMVLERKSSLTNEQILKAVRGRCQALGNDLRELCDMIGIHHVTGQILLTSGETK